MQNKILLISHNGQKLFIRPSHIKSIWIEEFSDDAVLNIRHGKITTVFAGTALEMDQLFAKIKCSIEYEGI
jgi:hypothetical protein